MSSSGSNKLGVGSGSGGGPPVIRLNLSSTAAAAAASSRASSPAPPATKKTRKSPPDNDNNKSGSGKDFNHQGCTFFQPTTPPPHITAAVEASHVRSIHQSTHLNLVFDHSQYQCWHAEGKTTIFCIHDKGGGASSSLSSSSSSSCSDPIQAMALHLRGCVQIKDVKIEALMMPAAGINSNNINSKPPTLQTRKSSFLHADPLEHVLLKPAESFQLEEMLAAVTTPRGEADSQCSRGAQGMTHGLRAASLASWQGEVRLSYERPEALIPPVTTNNLDAATSDAGANSNKASNKTTATAAELPTTKVAQQTLQAATDAWMAALKQDVLLANGSAKSRLQKRLRETRNPNHYTSRMQLCSKRLAKASCRPGSNTALKITIRFQLPTPSYSSQQEQHEHWGGWHVISGASGTTPHIYTTCGTYGDHQGPRCWLPGLDSAAARHRASHEFTVSVTAGLKQGISACGLGQDAGIAQAYLHVSNITTLAKDQAALLLLGGDHMALLQRVQQQRQQQQSEAAAAATAATTSAPHVIPPDTKDAPVVMSVNDVNVTYIWCTASWAPIPLRSLCFAVGPFRFLEDAEYFGMAAALAATQSEEDQEDDEDEDGTSSDSQKATHKQRHARYVKAAREHGEGIRQAYLAPLFFRKHIHAADTATTNRALLPNAHLALRPLTPDQWATLHQMDAAVQVATVGVPHRTLSLMRDVLAIPTYRSASYLQIWIPHAVQGGCTSGSLLTCPEAAGCNPFLGGSIMDARLLPPPKMRLPFYQGGRVLQFMQARNCVRGWITASLPLGGLDDVGHSYIHRLMEALFMSIYERGHGAFGEGGARGGIFYTRRFASQSGLNSSNLDFLPIRNMEDVNTIVDGVAAAVPLDETQNDYLWRSATNGTESHTSALDEFNARHLQCKDVLEVIERGTDKDKQVPSPGPGWGGVFGSYLSATFLSSNATSSSHLGCGAVELMHPLGGVVYRSIKMDVFQGIVEGRAGMANFIRLARASFVAAHLSDIGEPKLVLPTKKSKKSVAAASEDPKDKQEEEDLPPFAVCVNEILGKGGLTHTLFTRALQTMCGRHREALLAGTLVDVERNSEDPRTKKAFVDPEGFPNSYVRAASMMYCRVGVQVEQQSHIAGGSTANAPARIECQLYAEPIIPEGGVAFGGPITVRVVENEGQFREYEKDLTVDGSRRDWGSIALHAKPVSTPQAQAAASGVLESKSSKGGTDMGKTGPSNMGSVFTENGFHGGGFQAIELIRLTNLSPLLWVRVDPFDVYGGRISVFLPDACLAEQLFHDGDSSAQIEAIRALAERPLRIQGSMKVNVVHGVNVSELPVRTLGDCLRGSSALHSSLPHTPCVRRHAALAIGQWQNNKAPNSKNVVGADSWLGLNILIQYFQERFYSNSVVMPVKYSRVVIKHSEAEGRVAGSATEVGGKNNKSSNDDTFEYLDALDVEAERTPALDRADFVEAEEDEEYRVRTACVTAIASIRAQDGQTPVAVTKFLEAVLEAEDASEVGNLICSDDEFVLEHSLKRIKGRKSIADGQNCIPSPPFSFNSGLLVADTLLALCHLNVWPDVYTDPATGKSIQVSGKHPVAKLIELTQGWVKWELYREQIRSKVNSETLTVIGGNCYDVVASCAIVALSNLVILRQCTTIKNPEHEQGNGNDDPAIKAEYYARIFDSKPVRNDLTRAAAAQAMACICCAADRFEDSIPAVGLLYSLEFLLERIVRHDTSLSLRQTLSLIMMDVCSGKVCSMQRVGAIAGRNDLYTSASRFFCGPLGASHGGDNGSAIITAVTQASAPAASAVNDGARRGLRLVNKAGHPKESIERTIVVRVARFATRLWRVINGECPEPPLDPLKRPSLGVCAYDAALRCSLLCLWQWLWPRGCFAVLQVQSWKAYENTPEYKAMGADKVMKITEKEKEEAAKEENSLSDIARIVQMEMDRQAWRGEMAIKSFAIFKAGGGLRDPAKQDASATEQGIGQPLPPISRDQAFKQGGWIASAAQQRRGLALDGGAAVTSVRLKIGKAG